MGSSGCIMFVAQGFDNVLRTHLSYVRMSPFAVVLKISLASLNPRPLEPFNLSLRCKLRDLMGGLKGFVKGSHGILYLICLNDTGAAGDRSADR